MLLWHPCNKLENMSEDSANSIKRLPISHALDEMCRSSRSKTSLRRFLAWEHRCLRAGLLRVFQNFDKKASQRPYLSSLCYRATPTTSNVTHYQSSTNHDFMYTALVTVYTALLNVYKTWLTVYTSLLPSVHSSFVCVHNITAHH